MTDGICLNPTCPVAIAKTRLERYPGPGEFCPECGDELGPAPAEPVFGGLSPFEALQRFDVVESSEPAPPPPKRRRANFALISGGLATLVVGAGVIYGQSAIGKPAAASAVHVCRSSMTASLAGDLIRAYVARPGATGTRFETASGGGCDVRFAGDATLPAGAQLALDGLVVVVNPQNPVARLSRASVAQVFRGDVVEWSRLGGRPGRIDAYVPADGTDEAAVAARTIMLQSAFGARIHRLPTSADVVRAVAGPSGRRAIGIVSFSGAIPARVVAIGAAAPASPLSIADGRYPIRVPLGLSIDHDVPAARAFAEFARSDDGRAVAAHANLITKAGS